MKLETYLNAMLLAYCKTSCSTIIYNRNKCLRLARQYLKFRERVIQTDAKHEAEIALLKSRTVSNN